MFRPGHFKYAKNWAFFGMKNTLWQRFYDVIYPILLLSASSAFFTSIVVCFGDQIKTLYQKPRFWSQSYDS
jgi:hypothetical protein